MESPRPAGEAGRGGSGSAGRHDRAPYSAPVRLLRPELRDIAQIGAGGIAFAAAVFGWFVWLGPVLVLALDEIAGLLGG